MSNTAKKRVVLLTMLCLILFSFSTVFAGDTASLEKISISHNQYQGDIDGTYEISWNMWYGDNVTNWKLYEKKNTGSYQEIINEDLADNSPNAQNVVKTITGRKPGTYYYYAVFSNSNGSVESNQIQVNVGDPEKLSDIIINGVDTGYAEVQMTIDQGLNQYSLSCIGAENNPNFEIITNNNNVINPTIDASNLKIEGLKAGRASLKIKETTTGKVRYIGVRVRTTDGELPGMPNYLSVGSVSEDKDGDLNFWKDFHTDRRNKRMDIRYIYINGGPLDKGWRTWTTEDGGRAKTFITESRRLGMIPFFVYYNIPDTGESYQIDLNHIQDQDYMSAYYQDLKFFLDICKDYAEDDTVGIVFEPDFLGYMMQKSGKQPNQISAQVNQAYETGILDSNDPQFENNVTGLVKSINYIVKKYYPQAYYGWQFNIWAYESSELGSKGLLRKTDELGIEAGREYIRDKTELIVDYYTAAGVTSYGANFVSIDKYGLDGAYEAGAAEDPASSTWLWNADHWNNYLEFTEVLHQGSNLPVVLWQIPVGHVNNSQTEDPYDGGLFDPLDNSVTHYEDSAPTFFLGDTFKPGTTTRFHYFKENKGNDSKVIDNGTDTVTWESHMEEAKAKGVISVLFGAGVNSSTDGVGSPPTDDYWWITKVQDYFANPVPLDDSTPNNPQVNISVDNAVNTGTYTITAKVAADSTVDYLKIYEEVGGTSSVVKTKSITPNATIEQDITYSAANKAVADYKYTVEALNQNQVVVSDTVNVTVTNDNPTKTYDVNIAGCDVSIDGAKAVKIDSVGAKSKTFQLEAGEHTIEALYLTKTDNGVTRVFKSWSDGVTDNPRKIIVDGDMSFRAISEE